MDNNDIFRRTRYILGYDDAQMADVFTLADESVSPDTIYAWLKKEEDHDFLPMSDLMLATFLDGLINKLRGKKEGPQRAPEHQLNNNLIFKKLRIAFDLHSDDILEMFKLENMPISEHELSALFRSPSSSKYVECNDQYLRNFLNGLQKKQG